MSAFDKNAVEEAVRLKAAHGGEVAVFTVGAPDARKAVKEALAMGADRGVLIGDSKSAGDSLRTAEVLAAAVSKSGPYDLVLCSEGSSDTYTGLVPPMLAEVLKLPFIGYARKVVLAEGKVVAERSLESTIETVECTTPAVVSVVSEINEPRYPTLIQIMQASKKPMEEYDGAQLVPGRDGGRTSVVHMAALSSNRKKVVFTGSPEETARSLLEALEKEGAIPK